MREFSLGCGRGRERGIVSGFAGGGPDDDVSCFVSNPGGNGAFFFGAHCGDTYCDGGTESASSFVWNPGGNGAFLLGGICDSGFIVLSGGTSS